MATTLARDTSGLRQGRNAGPSAKAATDQRLNGGRSRLRGPGRPGRGRRRGAAPMGTGVAGGVATLAERSARSRELRVEIVSDDRAFLQLEPAWNALVREAGIEHPFLTHEWVRTCWECFGAGKSLNIAVVRAGSEIVAIAPLMRSISRIYGVPVRSLQFIANV